MKHKHRIIPGYEGGEYTEGNVIELTPTQHAMWHYAEWLRKENHEDLIAWKGLSKLISHEEAVSLACMLGGRKGGSRSKTALQRTDLKEIAEKLKSEYEGGAKIKELREAYQCGQGTLLEILRSVGTSIRKRGEGADRSYLRGNSHSSGYLWWTDGKIERSAKTCPGEGWRRGRVKRKRKPGKQTG